MYDDDFHLDKFGLFQHDVNVVWDLAPHDLSIIDHLIQKTPEAILPRARLI